MAIPSNTKSIPKTTKIIFTIVDIFNVEELRAAEELLGVTVDVLVLVLALLEFVSWLLELELVLVLLPYTVSSGVGDTPFERFISIPVA